MTNDDGLTKTDLRALNAHLRALNARLSDDLRRAGLAEQNLLRQMAEARQRIADLENPDHSWRERPDKGRYEGDLHGELTVLPGARRPYQVKVMVWRHSWSDDTVGWFQARRSDLFGEAFDHLKDFKRPWEAADYLGKVRGHADAYLIVKRSEKAYDAARTRIG